MPIHVSWQDDDQRLLRFVYEGKWTVADFYEALEQGNALLDSAPGPAVAVLDVRASHSMPNGFMGTIGNISKKRHPRMVLMVMLGMNPLVRGFISIYRKVYPTKPENSPIHFAVDEAEVEALAAQALQTVPDSNR